MDWNHIDWNGLLHLGGMVAGGYFAVSTLHWVVTDLFVPLVEILAAWSAFKGGSRAMTSYFDWKKAEASAAGTSAATEIKPPPAITRTMYVSPLRARLRRD